MTQLQFVGLSRVKEETVRAMIKAREGMEYTAQDEAADEAALRASGEFSSVSLLEIDLSPSTFLLTVEVAEAPAPRPPAAPARRSRRAAAAPPPILPVVPSSAAVQQAVIPSSAPAALLPPVAAPESLAPPWYIGDVVIQGSRNTAMSAIRAQIKARKGDLYDRADLSKDIKALYDMGGFERVSADVSAMPDKPVPPEFFKTAGSTVSARLTLSLEERPLVRKIRFDGNKNLGRGKLSDAVSTKEKDPLDRSKLDQDARKIVDLYREKGYLAAAADPKVSLDTATARADVAFAISEGPRTLIDQVVIVGASAFKPKKVAKQMEANRRKKVPQEAKLDDDLKKIESFYKNNGYLDFKIDSHTVVFSPDRTKVTITVWLEEGNPYRFGDTTFGGYSAYTLAELKKTVNYHKGKIFSQEKFEDTIHDIQYLYADKGYLRTKVGPQKTFNAATGLMDVNFDITEGGISYVDHIDVDGNRATKTYVIRREIVMKPGQPFSSSKLRKSMEKIRNLGFIDDVEPDIQTPEPDKADVTFDVTEGKPGTLSAAAGFSSLDGLIGTLSMQHSNLFGRAQRVGVQWSFGARVQDYSLSWTTPWVEDKPVSLGVDLFHTRRISPFETSSVAFTDKRQGGTIRVGPRFAEDMYRLDFSYTLMQISVTDVQTQFLSSLPAGTSVSSSLGASFTRDTRDNYLDPTRGSLNSIGTVLAGGPLQGKINDWSLNFQDAIHFTVANINDWPMVLGFSNRGAYVTSFGPTKDVPVFSRFFLGGQDTLRGYAPTGEVGSLNGGKVYDVFNAELGFPLAREKKKTIVKVVGFFDAGSSWDSVRAVNDRIGTQQTDIKTDVGIGLRFVTPAFPIRLDYGYGLEHTPGQKAYQINFGINSLF